MFNNNEAVRELVVRDKKIATTTANIKLAIKKLLTASIKVVLVENRKNMSMKMI